MQTLEFTGRAARGHKRPLDRGFAAATERQRETPKTVTSKASQDALNETLNNLLNPSSSFKDYGPGGISGIHKDRRKSTFNRKSYRGSSVVEREGSSPGTARFLGYAHNTSNEVSPGPNGGGTSTSSGRNLIAAVRNFSLAVERIEEVP